MIDRNLEFPLIHIYYIRHTVRCVTVPWHLATRIILNRVMLISKCVSRQLWQFLDAGVQPGHRLAAPLLECLAHLFLIAVRIVLIIRIADINASIQNCVI